jgi:hypothetical protein
MNKMKTDHTSGPWKHDPTWGLIKHGKNEICALHSGNLANADIISAAPDMLDALQAIVDAFGDQDSLLIDQCKAAISKAKGIMP